MFELIDLDWGIENMIHPLRSTKAKILNSKPDIIPAFDPGPIGKRKNTIVI